MSKQAQMIQEDNRFKVCDFDNTDYQVQYCTSYTEAIAERNKRAEADQPCRVYGCFESEDQEILTEWELVDYYNNEDQD